MLAFAAVTLHSHPEIRLFCSTSEHKAGKSQMPHLSHPFSATGTQSHSSPDGSMLRASFLPEGTSFSTALLHMPSFHAGHHGSASALHRWPHWDLSLSPHGGWHHCLGSRSKVSSNLFFSFEKVSILWWSTPNMRPSILRILSDKLSPALSRHQNFVIFPN